MYQITGQGNDLIGIFKGSLVVRLKATVKIGNLQYAISHEMQTVYLDIVHMRTHCAQSREIHALQSAYLLQCTIQTKGLSISTIQEECFWQTDVAKTAYVDMVLEHVTEVSLHYEQIFVRISV